MNCEITLVLLIGYRINYSYCIDFNNNDIIFKLLRKIIHLIEILNVFYSQDNHLNNKG